MAISRNPHDRQVPGYPQPSSWPRRTRGPERGQGSRTGDIPGVGTDTGLLAIPLRPVRRPSAPPPRPDPAGTGRTGGTIGGGRGGSGRRLNGSGGPGREALPVRVEGTLRLGSQSPGLGSLACAGRSYVKGM